MAREAIKKAGAGAIEGTLQTFMPQLMDQFRRLHDDMRQLEAKIDHLEAKMYDKFEQQRDVSNELGQRIAKMEGAYQLHVSAMNRQTDRMDEWFERLVQVESIPPRVRSRKAS